jgi:hypothetical protein
MKQRQYVLRCDLINHTQHYINMIVASILLSSFATLYMILV